MYFPLYPTQILNETDRRSSNGNKIWIQNKSVIFRLITNLNPSQFQSIIHIFRGLNEFLIRLHKKMLDGSG